MIIDGELAGCPTEIWLVGHYNKAEIYGFLDADGATLIDGAECATSFIAMTVDLNAAARKEIGDGSAYATRGGKVRLAFGAESLTIAASSLFENELALYPRSVKKA